MGEGVPVGVSIRFHNTQDDLRAAARLASRSVPAVMRQRRLLLVVNLVLALAWLVLVVADRAFGGHLTPILLPIGLVTVGVTLLNSERGFVFQVLRQPTSRRVLGDLLFQADSAQIASSNASSSGAFVWSAVDRIVEGDDILLFVIGEHLWLYVPTRALSDADRATIRQLAGAAVNGPEWVDRRAGTSGAPRTAAT